MTKARFSYVDPPGLNESSKFDEKILSAVGSAEAYPNVTVKHERTVGRHYIEITGEERDVVSEVTSDFFDNAGIPDAVRGPYDITEAVLGDRKKTTKRLILAGEKRVVPAKVEVSMDPRW